MKYQIICLLLWSSKFYPCKLIFKNYFMGSQHVPQVPNVFPNVFPIAPHLIPSALPWVLHSQNSGGATSWNIDKLFCDGPMKVVISHLNHCTVRMVIQYVVVKFSIWKPSMKPVSGRTPHVASLVKTKDFTCWI